MQLNNAAAHELADYKPTRSSPFEMRYRQAITPTMPTVRGGCEVNSTGIGDIYMHFRLER
jgi:hypothetical protein